MKLCIVGGVFDRSAEYRAKHVFTPETVLAEGLRARGIDVDVCGHRHFDPADAYDIVHVHHLGKAALRMATAATRSLFVYSSHDPRLVSDYRISRTRMLATKFIVNRSDAVVALSETEAGIMERHFGQYRARTVAIGNGFPSDVFYYAPRPARTDGPYQLLFVGQLIEQKGVDVLLRAMQIVQKAKNVELSLVYHNPQLEAQYKELAAELGVADRVHFIGFKSAFDLAEMYRRADLFVLPTFAEALPSVVTEAMMSGLPVVATRVAGIPEQVGTHGTLVLPGDVGALADAIVRTLDALAAGALKPETVSAYATARFSVQTMVEKHLRLYEDLLRAGQAPMRSQRRYQPMNAVTRAFLTTLGGRLAGRGLLSA
jgi:glycosyltransferase involved in cell wall biosynthesis